MSTKEKQALEQQLWQLRDDYLKDLPLYSFDKEKDLKPPFQNAASYQEIATKHFLEFALQRLDFGTHLVKRSNFDFYEQTGWIIIQNVDPFNRTDER